MKLEAERVKVHFQPLTNLILSPPGSELRGNPNLVRKDNRTLLTGRNSMHLSDH